jgi:propanediol dehydratase small subunit
MPQQPLPTGPDVDRLMVPDDLLRQLHDANERFRLAKEQLQKTTDDSDDRHVARVEERFVELRKAERDLEELTAKVQEILHRPA